MMIENLTAECYFCGSDDIRLQPQNPVINRLANDIEITAKVRCGVCGGKMIIWTMKALVLDIEPNDEPPPDDVEHEQHD